MLSLLNSLKISLLMSAIFNLAKYCVFGHIGILRQFLHRKTILFFVTFSKSNAFVLLGVAPKDTCALRGSIPLENLRAQFYRHIAYVFVLGETPNPHPLVRSQRKGRITPSFFLAFFIFDASPRQGLRKSAYSPTLDLGSLVSSRFYVRV